jgi:phosphate-selective porin OprO/OprP
VKHHHAERNGRNGADDLRDDAPGERDPRRADLVPLLLLFVDGVVCGLFGECCVVHAPVNAQLAVLNAAFKHRGCCVNSHVPVMLAILVLLAAVPAAAQPTSIKAGDWLRIDVRARFQGDIRKSEASIRGDEDGGLDIARRRVGLDGRVKHVDFQIEYEFAVRQWRDVYVDYRQFKVVRVRGGMFKLPFGLEENTSATSLDFIYRSRISARLAPGRDRGVLVHGRVVKNMVTYEAGVFRNDGDNARPSNSARVFGRTTSAARVVVHPFRGTKKPMGDLQFGAALTSSDVPLGFPAVRARTVLGASFFDSDVWVQGHRQRTGFEARWQPGRMSIQSEYIRLTDERRGQSVTDGDLSPLVAHGWYVSGTYGLTRKKSRFGRVEAAARYETLSFGSDSDDELSTSARAAAVLGNIDRAMTLGVNWHMNKWVKLQGNVIREEIGRPSMGPMSERARFWSRVFRLQLTL